MAINHPKLKYSKIPTNLINDRSEIHLADKNCFIKCQFIKYETDCLGRDGMHIFVLTRWFDSGPWSEHYYMWVPLKEYKFVTKKQVTEVIEY